MNTSNTFLPLKIEAIYNKKMFLVFFFHHHNPLKCINSIEIKSTPFNHNKFPFFAFGSGSTSIAVNRQIDPINKISMRGWPFAETRKNRDSVAKMKRGSCGQLHWTEIGFQAPPQTKIHSSTARKCGKRAFTQLEKIYFFHKKNCKVGNAEKKFASQFATINIVKINKYP